MGTMQWLRHFQHSVERPRAIDWSQGVALSPRVLAPVLDSMRTFQRGLSSPGNDLRTKVRSECSPEYSEAVDLYVREKNVHADLLARWIWAAGSRPMKRQWVDFAFRHIRRRFDWAGEIKVLLTADIVAVPFFRVLANNIHDPLLTEVAETVLRDQAYHLGFHIDHLREEMASRTPMQRAILQQSWGAFFASTLSIVMADNRDVFEAIGYDKLAFWTDAWNLFAQVQSGLNGSQHMGAMLARDPRIQFAL